MIQYVQNGGSIFFIGDHYNADRNKNRWDASEVFNGYRRGAYSNPKGIPNQKRNLGLHWLQAINGMILQNLSLVPMATALVREGQPRP
jgi:hypothetical protein